MMVGLKKTGWGMVMVVAVCLAMAGLNPPPAAAGSYSLLPAADAMLWSGEPNNNYGNHTPLSAFAYTGSNTRSLLRFDLSAIQDAEIVTQATLRLYRHAFYIVAPATSVTADLYRVASDSWGEMAVTWNNQPAPASLLGALTLTSGDPLQGWMYYSLPVGGGSNWVGDLNDNAVSFLLKLNNESLATQRVYWRSDEYPENPPTTHPHLDITTIPIPLPGGALLAGSGFMALLWRRWRRKERSNAS
jgi:hypothetical protein